LESKKAPQIIMAQLGRREHYAIPIALHRTGMLGHFFTDTYVGPGSWLHHFAKLVPSSCKKGPIAHAFTRSGAIPGEKVTAFNFLGALHTYKLSQAKSLKELRQVYVWASKQFSKQILKYKEILFSSQAIYALNGALELFSFGKSQGLKLIFNQMDPSFYEDKLLIEEFYLWPDWQTEPHTLCEDDEIIERRLTEWQLADTIIVNSDFSKNALMTVGVDSSKIRVVPLAVDTKRFYPFKRQRKNDKVNILFLGQVCLRKGIHYTLEAMRLVRSNNITLTISGSIDLKLNREKLQSYSDLYNYTGYIAGDKVVNNYRMADIFIFPTISDGFGLTQLEAMACGLPVITTPNCAALVRDGIDGFIVPIRDAQALAEKMDILAHDPELRAWMSQNARQRAEEFSWERYGDRLIEQCLGVMKEK
jgi:glycosyltransferase involved in cell wall biosynthesis